MTATLTAIPAREELAFLIGEAIGHRVPQVSGCCWQDSMCDSHGRDRLMTAALRLAQMGVERSDSDAEALEVIRSLAPRVIDEITGATTDENMIAAITGGTDGGNVK
jgi:hypothetical protein